MAGRRTYEVLVALAVDFAGAAAAPALGAAFAAVFAVLAFAAGALPAGLVAALAVADLVWRRGH